MSDIETRVQQIAQVLGQLEDTQVPRNIRNSVRDAVEKWLLNKDKEMDIRLGLQVSLMKFSMMQIYQSTTVHFAYRFKPL